MTPSSTAASSAKRRPAAVEVVPGWSYKRMKIDNPWERAIVIEDDEPDLEVIDRVDWDNNFGDTSGGAQTFFYNNLGRSNDYDTMPTKIRAEHQPKRPACGAVRGPLPIWQQPTPPATRASRTDAIKDHRGLPLSPAALEMATEYWNCQREYELCPLDAEDQIYGPQQQSDPLLRQARFRREYTRLIFGLDVLPPGARTFEPPYIAAARDSTSRDNGPARSAPNSAAHILPSLKPSPMARPAPSQFPSAQPTEHALPSQFSSAQHTTNALVSTARSALAFSDWSQAPHTQATPADTELLQLSDEQSQIVKLAESGQNIFFTGSAGTGKSTVLHAIRKRLEDLGKNVAVMAPTGKVALAINGTTTWTYCGWTPDAYKRTLEQLRRSAGSRHIRSRFEKTDVIIIDEISMVENLHFERMNAVIKHGRKTPKLPFGGLQVIVTGDFCQLPPVKPFSHCMKCGQEMKMNYLSKETGYVCPKACQEPYKDSDKWAFKSAAWKECNFVNVLLTAIHRQHDACFISLLQKCRMGIQLHQEEIDLLIDHPCDTTNAVKLFATREEVRKVNQEEYDRLYTIEHRYHAYDDFYWERDAHPNLGSKATRSKDDCLNALSDHRFDPNVWLKEGMLVVLLVNLDLSQGLCNGSQGVIVGFQPYDPKDLPRRGSKGTGSRDFLGGMLGAHGAIKDDHVNRFCRYQIDTGRVPLEWPIVKFHNGVTATIFPECQVNEIGDVKPYSLLCRTQMPLAPAWALSIHRSQGMTLDRVIVDLSRIFEEGQMYVALSRATSLEGLRIEGDPSKLSRIGEINGEVQQFLWDTFPSELEEVPSGQEEALSEQEEAAYM